MGGVLMFRSERMRRTGARSTASETSSHMQSWADCITGTLESSYWKRQPAQPFAVAVIMRRSLRQAGLNAGLALAFALLVRHEYAPTPRRPRRRDCSASGCNRRGRFYVLAGKW